MDVAATALPAFEQGEALSDLGKVGNQRLAVFGKYLCSDRQMQNGILATAAIAGLAHTVGAAIGLEMLLVAKIDQGVQPLDAIRDQFWLGREIS